MTKKMTQHKAELHVEEEDHAIKVSTTVELVELLVEVLAELRYLKSSSFWPTAMNTLR